MVSINPVMSPNKKGKVDTKNVQKYRPSYSNQSKSEWGVESILAGMGIEEEYIELFVNNNIDTDTFMILEEDDLVEVGVHDTSVRARIMDGVQNCRLRKVNQNQLHKQFSVVDGTRILVSCANQLDTLCNLLKYTRHRLNKKPVVNQYLDSQYSASKGMQDLSLALLSRTEKLNVELQELQQMMRQEGEKPKKIVTRLKGPHEQSSLTFLTKTLLLFPIFVVVIAWKMKGSLVRN